jgi:hypothetical protein
MVLSYKPTTRDIKLAKSLVHPEKEIRDATIVSLKQYLTNLEQVDEVEMLKLWKALFYCYWLVDKQPIQQELAENLSCLISSSSSIVWTGSSPSVPAVEALKKNEMILCYIKCFFLILLREWSYLDFHHMNKFYLFIRIFLNHIFQYYAAGSCTSSLSGTDGETGKSEDKGKKGKKSKKTIKKNEEESNHHNGNKKSWKDIHEFHTILSNEILTKTPNDIRYHITGIYLEELSHVSQGKGLSSDDFLIVIAPFLSALTRNDDLNYIERVYTTIFYKFLKEYSYEAMEEKESLVNDDDQQAVNGSGNEKKHYYFEEVNTKVLQKRIFELVSSPNTNERFHKKLYELHKTISLKIGTPFINDDMDVMSPPSSSNGKKASTSSSSNDFSNTESKPSTAVVGGKRRLDDFDDITSVKKKRDDNAGGGVEDEPSVHSLFFDLDNFNSSPADFLRCQVNRLFSFSSCLTFIYLIFVLLIFFLFLAS